MRKRTIWIAQFSCGDELSMEIHADGSHIEIGGERDDFEFIIGPGEHDFLSLDVADMREVRKVFADMMKEMKK